GPAPKKFPQNCACAFSVGSSKCIRPTRVDRHTEAGSRTFAKFSLDIRDHVHAVVSYTNNSISLKCVGWTSSQPGRFRRDTTRAITPERGGFGNRWNYGIESRDFPGVRLRPMMKMTEDSTSTMPAKKLPAGWTSWRG